LKGRPCDLPGTTRLAGCYGAVTIDENAFVQTDVTENYSALFGESSDDLGSGVIPGLGEYAEGATIVGLYYAIGLAG
jgi:hypothetical protein